MAPGHFHGPAQLEGSGAGGVRDRALTLLMTRYLIWGKQLPTATSHLPWCGVKVALCRTLQSVVISSKEKRSLEAHREYQLGDIRPASCLFSSQIHLLQMKPVLLLLHLFLEDVVMCLIVWSKLLRCGDLC